MNFMEIRELFDALHIRQDDPGYRFLACAVSTAMEHGREAPVTLGCLYRQVAGSCQVSYSTVEHTIRDFLRTYWNQEAACQFRSVTGYPARQNCNTKEFIFILAEYLTIQTKTAS